jgi:ribosomal protein S27AE
MKKLEINDKFINKYIFWNTKLMAVGVIIGLIWVFVYVFIISSYLTTMIKSDELIFLFDGGIAGAGGGIIMIIMGIIGKIIFSKKTIKCRNCGYISRADKYHCGNCGEKLYQDDLLKFP